MATTVKPTVHRNGTSRERLLDGFIEAGVALHAALEKMAEAGPNGRDFYPQGAEAMLTAQREHQERMDKVRGVLSDYEALSDLDARL